MAREQDRRTLDKPIVEIRQGRPPIRREELSDPPPSSEIPVRRGSSDDIVGDLISEVQRERHARLEAEQRAKEAEDIVTRKAIHKATLGPEGRKTARLLGSVLAGALGIGGAGLAGNRIAQFDPKPAPATVVDFQAKTIKALQERIEALEENTFVWAKADYADRQAKERILVGWACARGFRADNVNCDALKSDLEAEDNLSKSERARMVWTTRSKWPDPRKPPPKPAPQD